LFDLDGTLVDSIPFLLECFASAAREALACEVAPERVAPLVGLPLRTMFERFAGELTDERAAACVAAYRAAYHPHVTRRSPLFSDAVAALDALGALGLGLGVVTGKTLEGAERVLGPLGLLGRFGALVGADHGGAPKPAPDGALAAAIALGAEPAETVVVGDSLLDVEMALAAGMTAVGVTTGTGSRAPREARAHYVIDALAELPPLVGRIAPASMT
jgi:HAD superfamily hydrolase (TIGR01509 family)